MRPSANQRLHNWVRRGLVAAFLITLALGAAAPAAVAQEAPAPTTTSTTAAPSVDDIAVGLRGEHDALALRVLDDQDVAPSAPPSDDLGDRIVEALVHTGPLTPRQLRAACRVRMARVYDVLRLLAADGRVVRNGAGYQLA